MTSLSVIRFFFHASAREATEGQHPMSTYRRLRERACCSCSPNIDSVLFHYSFMSDNISTDVT